MEKKSAKLEKLYLIAFSLYLFQSFLSTTMFITIIPSVFFTIIKVISILLVFIKIIMEKYNKKKFVIILISSFLLIISALISSYGSIFIFLLFIVGAYNVCFRKIVKLYFSLCLVLLIISIISSKIGIIQDLIYTKNGRLRDSFGIVYPTDFASHVFFIMISYIYLKGKDINFFNYIIILIVSLLVYYFCYTRLDISCMLLLIIISYMYKKNKINFKNKYIKLTLIFSFVICAFIGIFLTLNYDYRNEKYVKIDQLLSGRLTIGKMMYNQYGVKWFGQEINDYGFGGSLVFKYDTYNYIDCSYLRILLKYGIVTFTLLVLFNIMFYRKLYNNGNNLLLLLMLVVSINSIVAQHYIDFSYNFLLFSFLSKIESEKI